MPSDRFAGIEQLVGRTRLRAPNAQNRQMEIVDGGLRRGPLATLCWDRREREKHNHQRPAW